MATRSYSSPPIACCTSPTCSRAKSCRSWIRTTAAPPSATPTRSTKVLGFSEKNADVIVNGHNNTTSTNADLKDYIQFIRGYVKDVQDAKKSGKTVDDVADSWKPPSGYTAQPARLRANSQFVFNETK